MNKLYVRIIISYLLIGMVYQPEAFAFFSKCHKIDEVIARHKDDMFLHRKVNAKGVTEYVWVRSGKNGDIEFVYHLREGRLCLFEKYTY